MFNEIIKTIRKLHKDMPDLRFGEVIQNAIDSDVRLTNVNINDKSDKVLFHAIKKYYLKHTEARQNGNKKH